MFVILNSLHPLNTPGPPLPSHEIQTGDLDLAR